MQSPRTNTIARHVEVAQRLLAELERHAEAAQHALGRDNGADFFAAVDARDAILGELDVVVTSIAHERSVSLEAGLEQDAITNQLLSEMAQAAARALESHDRLAVRARRERDRLGFALQRADRPDSVATQYAVASAATRPRAFSVTG
jgi:hypothetical protein